MLIAKINGSLTAYVSPSLGGEISGFQLSLYLVAAFIVIRVLARAVYNLFLSPISHFPGPRLAAVSGWYEFYFDCIQKGRFTWEVERLHDIYGPIVRINPNELSICDGSFYDKVYVPSSVRRTDRYMSYTQGLDFEDSHFLSQSHDLHRRRRKPIELYFSRLGVTKYEPVIHHFVRKLMDRFESLRGTGKIVHLEHAMLAFTGDVIGHLCCEKPAELLDDENFSPSWYELQHDVIKSIPLLTSFPWMVQVLKYFPKGLSLWMNPKAESFARWRADARAYIQQVKNDNGNAGPGERTKIPGGRTSLFHHLAKTSSLPETETSVDRLTKEAVILLAVGSLSPARVLHFICYHLAADKLIQARLRNELSELMRNWPESSPAWAELEKLPYLQALIKEGLRCSYGAMRRLPRVSPEKEIKYGQWVIPAGVPVGMSAYLQHTDPDVYPEPFQFKPERWMEDVTPQMARNFVPFSKGSRNCLGFNLAYAEISIALAALFSPTAPKMQLFKTDETDIIAVHDFIVPLPRLDSKGVRIILA